jgi:hypothetical protein
LAQETRPLDGRERFQLTSVERAQFRATGIWMISALDIS